MKFDDKTARFPEQTAPEPAPAVPPGGIAEKRRALDYLNDLCRQDETVLLLDLYGRIQNISRFAAGRLRRNRDELIGTCIWNLMPPDVAETRKVFFDLAAQSGRSVRHEDQWGERWNDVAVYPVRNASQEVISLLVMARDITAYKKTELALTESEKKFKAVAQSASDAIFITDENAALIFWNRATEKMFGYSGLELTNKRSVIFVPEHLRKSIVQAMRLFNTGGGSAFMGKVIEGTGLKKNGAEFPVELSVSSWSVNRQTYISTIMRDITERKRTEQKLLESHQHLERSIRKRTEELEEKNMALNVLLNKRKEDKKDLEKSVVQNLNSLVLPYIEKLKSTQLDEIQQQYLRVLETHLNEIASPFLRTLTSGFNHLTPNELKIAGLIKHGKSSKEIAEMLCLSNKTVDAYRINLRKKLGIKNRKINLRTHLATLPNRPE